MKCKVTKYPKPNVETLKKKEVQEEENQIKRKEVEEEENQIKRKEVEE